MCVFGQLCASRAYLHVSVGAGDDVDAVSVLLVLQDTGVVFSGQDEQKIFALTLHIKQSFYMLPPTGGFIVKHPSCISELMHLY